MSAPTSNVRAVSNVFPVQEKFIRVSNFTGGRSGVCDDPVFRRQVRGKAALKKLAEEKCGASIYEADLLEKLRESELVEEWQITVFWQREGGGRCAECPPGERPIGLVRGPGGEGRVENRCTKPHCRTRPEGLQSK